MWDRNEAEPQTAPGGRSRAVLGSSIAIEGKLAGQEDLVIDGQFDGEIRIPGHQVTVGKSGKVAAEVQAKLIVVEGTLRGNLVAEQQVVVRTSGQVEGDIRAPRVALEEGCRFKGNIDMEPPGRPAAAAAETSRPAPPPATTSKEGSGKGTEGAGGAAASGSDARSAPVGKAAGSGGR